MKKIMIIGFGAITHAVLARLPVGVEVGWIVARPHHHHAIRQLFSGKVQALVNPQQCQDKPDLVLECAGQQAVEQFAEDILAQGWHLAVISTGALANKLLHQRLQQSIQRGGGQLQVLSGAITGMDGLAAAREGGLESVTYTSNKSPASWRGSPAEKLIDLTQIKQATVFFTGTAREAATLFPANANVAATIALMGIGMEQTQVQLRADPNTQHNTHQIHVQGKFGQFNIELAGNPLAENPKTSMLAALSVVSACRRLVSGDLGV